MVQPQENVFLKKKYSVFSKDLREYGTAQCLNKKLRHRGKVCLPKAKILVTVKLYFSSKVNNKFKTFLRNIMIKFISSLQSPVLDLPEH